MKKPTLKALVLISLCALLLASCEIAYPPVIANGCSEPIEIRVSFEGKPSKFPVDIPTGEAYWQHERNLNIIELTVLTPARLQHVYTKADFEKLRAGKDIKFEVWVITESELLLKDRDDLPALRKAAKK